MIFLFQRWKYVFFPRKMAIFLLKNTSVPWLKRQETDGVLETTAWSHGTPIRWKFLRTVFLGLGLGKNFPKHPNRLGCKVSLGQKFGNVRKKWMMKKNEDVDDDDHWKFYLKRNFNHIFVFV